MEKINFVNGSAPALNATNLNQLQNNVENAIPEIVDDLTTEEATKVLSANQGKILNEKIDGIIESGSNDKGFYIKYANGDMVCRHTFEPSTFNGDYRYYSGVWTYPVAFTEAPTVTATANNWNTYSVTVKVKPTATICQVMVYLYSYAINQLMDDRSTPTNLIAIGRWK